MKQKMATVTVDARVIQKFKTFCQKQGIKVGWKVQQLMEKWIEEQKNGNDKEHSRDPHA
jgi:hypothetical protein